MKDIQNDKGKEIESFLELKYKLEIIKEEVVNIAYAIHWAKANIVNSYIMSTEEIDIAKKIFEKDNIPFVNLDEALEFSEIKIATNGKTIIYIISLPTTENQICQTIDIRAVKKNNKINKINFNSILSCEKIMYGIKSNCKQHNSLQICLRDNLLDLSNDYCISNLLTSRLPNCTVTNSQHIPDFEELSPGILILNDFKGYVLINEDSTTLNGTFIIHFNNATIQINGKKFCNAEKSINKPLPAILQPISLSNRSEEILSLEMLKQLNFNNTKEISLTESSYRLKYATSISLMIIFIIITIFLTKLVQSTRENKETQSINLTETAIKGLNQIFNKTSNEDI